MAARILILSADFGSGHLQAARAIAAACRERDPQAAVEALNVDGLLARGVSAGYLALLNRAPGAYRELYHAQTGAGVRRLIRTAFGPVVSRLVRQMQPTHVIATHPFPGLAVVQLRRTGRLPAPVVMALTDFVPHGLWVDEGADLYCVAADETAARLRLLGAPADRIAVTGIPLRAEFGRPLPSPAAARHVLVMGGGLGLGPITEAVRSLALLPRRDLQVTIICGGNANLQRELKDLFGADARIQVLGFTDQIADLMDRSHLLVTKPGGITCSESMARCLPLLLLEPLPGHEEANADFLCRTGAARVVPETQVGAAAGRLLYDCPEEAALMRESARLTGRPHAASQIANLIFIRSTQNRNIGAIG